MVSNTAKGNWNHLLHFWVFIVAMMKVSSWLLSVQIIGLSFGVDTANAFFPGREASVSVENLVKPAVIPALRARGGAGPVDPIAASKVLTPST